MPFLEEKIEKARHRYGNTFIEQLKLLLNLNSSRRLSIKDFILYRKRQIISIYTFIFKDKKKKTN